MKTHQAIFCADCDRGSWLGFCFATTPSDEVFHVAGLETPHAENFVKITAGDESFWAQIETITLNKITVRVDNYLVCSDVHGIHYDDRIEFSLPK